MSTAPAASASGAGWRQNLGHALMATVLTAIVVTPIFGLHLERAGVRTHIVPQWHMVGWACLIVFVVQLLHPWIFGRATSSTACPCSTACRARRCSAGTRSSR